MATIQDRVILNNGQTMPRFGLGVYKVEEGKEVTDSVINALEAGYRLIDTAAFYKNEVGVGKAIKESGLPREEIFVTTKVWNTDQGYDQTLRAFEKSLKSLDLDYLDLYLIHWPVKEKYLDTWTAMEKLHKEGLIKSIGVSNFHIHHLKDLMENSFIKPAVNQVELHPRLSQIELRNFCKEHNIQVEAWSPIARGRILSEPTLNYLSNKYGKSPAQIILRWHLQNDIIVIPKSSKKERIIENAQIFDFELTLEDMQQIDNLNMNERFGQDPDNFSL